MYALSVKQPWASLIALGEKTIECRSWSTSYRGDLLIVSSASPRVKHDGRVLPAGYALAVVRLVDVVPFSRDRLEASCMDDMPPSGAFAWLLEDVFEIEPFRVKGKLGIYQVICSPAFLASAEHHLLLDYAQ